MGWKSGHTLSWVLCLGLCKAEIKVLDRLHSHRQALPGMEQHLSSVARIYILEAGECISVCFLKTGKKVKVKVIQSRQSFSGIWLFMKTWNREKKRTTAALSFCLQRSPRSGVLRLTRLVQANLGFSLFWLTYYPLIKDLYVKNPFISAIFHWLEGDHSVHSHSREGCDSGHT